MTERRPAKPEPCVRASTLELRAYLLAFVAAVYAVTWRAVSGGSGGPAPSTAAAPIEDPVVAEAVGGQASAAPAPRVVWIDALPPGARPVVALPAGWQIASTADPGSARVTAQAAAPMTRAPARRRIPRIRTRSS